MEFSVKPGEGDDHAITIVPKEKTKKIKDPAAWLWAWNIYLQCMQRFSPHSMPHLLSYQSLISSMSIQYNFKAVFLYGRAFRMRMAMDNTRRWDRVDEEIYNENLRGASAPITNALRCFSCNSPHHLAPSCANKKAKASASSTNSSQTARLPPVAFPPSTFSSNQAPNSFMNSQTNFSPPMPPNLAFPSICYKFNKESCTTSACKYGHYCWFCRGNHPPQLLVPK